MIIRIILSNDLYLSRAMLMWGIGSARLNYHASHTKCRRIMSARCCARSGNESKRKPLPACPRRGPASCRKSRLCSHANHEYCTCLYQAICPTILRINAVLYNCIDNKSVWLLKGGISYLNKGPFAVCSAPTLFQGEEDNA